MIHLLFSLLSLEILLGYLMWRRRTSYPITTAAIMARSTIYLLSLIDYYCGSFLDYRAGVIGTRMILRLLVAGICVESVWLMAQGIPQVRRFALASSLVFAALGVVAGVVGGGLLKGTWMDVQVGVGVDAWTALSIGCLAYLMLNHWLYSRAKPMGGVAERHWRGAITLVATLMIGYGLIGRGVELGQVGQVVVRVGSLASLVIWMGGASVK